MQTKIRNTFKLSAVLLLVLALLGSGLYRWNGEAASLPATPCVAVGTVVTCDLWAMTGSVTLPDGSTAAIWGYAANATDPASLPGPVLIVNEGDTVTVNLHNGLSENTALLFQGQSMIPDTVGVAPGEMKTYTFTASKAGTYLYEASPLLAAHQSAMGLYGALVVQSATPGTAYGSAATAFDEEALLVLSEIDPILNNSATPAAFDMRNYHPTVFLINGASYPDTASIEVTAGNAVLLRIVNAGVQSHSISTLGLTQNLVALDGSPFNFPRKLIADTMFPGQTSDVLVQTAALAQDGTKYAVYDAAFILSNNTSSGFGGMLTFVTLTSGTVISTDTVGPLTSGMTLSDYRVSGGSVTLDASISDALSGNGSVVDAEFFLDATGLDGSGTHFTGAAYGTETVSVSAVIDVDALALATGSHTIYVHGKDNALPTNNWGAFSSVELAVDHDGPVIIGGKLIPNPSNGSVSVLVEASADDRATGNGVIQSVEYSIDGGGTWLPMVFQTSASTYFYTVSLDSPAAGSVLVRATDDLGNIGPVFSDLSLMIDTTGPVTSNVVATPDSTNGIDQGVNSSIAAVRITADFIDGPSNISAAEGFIDTAGANGSGFLFIAADGLFDSLSESGYADIPLSTFWVLPAGSHTIYVHAQDASGNWGATSSVIVNVTHP
jgi:FtsP/CotA-like multicopper oxidase with cupredoxin domain